MDDIFPGHLSQPSEDSFENKLPLVDCVFRKIIETSADGIAFDILQSKIY